MSLQGYQLTNVSQPGKLWTFQCQAINEPWYVRSPWLLAIIVIGATLVTLALLFLCCYRKGARPAFVQQYFNMKKRLQVRHCAL